MPIFPPDNDPENGSGSDDFFIITPGTPPGDPGVGDSTDSVVFGGNDGVGNTTTIGLLYSKALREISDWNLIPSINHRYRGFKESNKFNLSIQGLLCVLAFLLPKMRARNLSLQIDEGLIYPTEDEVSEFYHSREQIRFKEFMLLKSVDIRWYL